MDIYAILKSKPHNAHFLNRYILFIEYCKSKNVDISGYVENHHICPKSKYFFPKYSSFKKFPWNSIKLTARQHFIAHWILAKAYGGTMWHAFQMISVCENSDQERIVVNSGRIYEEIRKNLKASDETRNKMSESANKRPPVSIEARNNMSIAGKGRIVTDETRQKISIIHTALKDVKSEKMSKRKWYNNGTISKRLNPEMDDLVDWVPGRIKLSKPRKSSGKWTGAAARRSYSGGGNPSAKKVCAAGIIFETLRAAAAALNCSVNTVGNRCNSNKAKFENWYYL